MKNHIIDKYFPVLDHGFIALKDYMGSDEDIEEAARTSYKKGTRKKSETRGLLRYLMRKSHTSPFEMCEMKFHIRLPIFVMRQLVRHRTANLNEMSLRYSVAPLVYFTPSDERMQRQKKTNKQGSDQETIAHEKILDIKNKWEHLRNQSNELYLEAIDEDLSRELARIDLPVSLYTEVYWKLDLHNIFHFLSLRCDGHAQEEIRVYADKMAAMVKTLYPIAFEAWYDYRFMSEKFSHQEMIIIRNMIQVVKGGLSQSEYLVSQTDTLAKRDTGLPEREWNELLNKFRVPSMKEFVLDLNEAKNADFFEQSD